MAPATHQTAGQASHRREHSFIGGEVFQKAASRPEGAALAGPVYAWSKGEAATVGCLAALEPARADAFHHHVLFVVVCEVGVVVQLPLQTAVREGLQVLGTPTTADTVQQQRIHQSQPSHGRTRGHAGSEIRLSGYLATDINRIRIRASIAPIDTEADTRVAISTPSEKALCRYMYSNYFVGPWPCKCEASEANLCMTM